MANNISYTQRLKILESRVIFANYVKRRQEIQNGNLIGLETCPPVNDASIWQKIETGAVTTTVAEYNQYLGISDSTSVPIPPIPTTVPDPPTNIVAVADNGQATITFTPPSNDGGSTILYYTVLSTPGSIVAYSDASPITILGLSNGTSYTFTMTATNAVGESDPSDISNSVSPTNSSLSAPTITKAIPTNNSIVVSFNTPLSFGTITNYEYSTDGGSTFTALSPVDASSPITIPSLSPTTLYNIAIRAVNNVPSSGDPSNIVPVKTKTTMVMENFNNVGTTSWKPPVGVFGVQYVVIGGGGGGGGCYSKVTVLGDVPMLSSAPAGGGYWIYNGTTNANYTNGRMYNGANVNPNYTTFPDPVRLTGVGTTFLPSQFGGSGAASQYIYGGIELVYNWSTPVPTVTNFGYPAYSISSSYNNNISGGSGGGAGAQVKAIFVATSFYAVDPATSYTIIVGDGGDGGAAGTNTESQGGKGGDSTFDTITATGGSGGQPSRVLTNGTGGNGNGGRGQTTLTNLIGGYGGQGVGGSGGQGLATTGGSGGAASFVQITLWPGIIIGGGGAGGAPNTIGSTAPIANRGYGGMGTGCTLNSFASGVKGGSGAVILKYYV